MKQLIDLTLEQLNWIGINLRIFVTSSSVEQADRQAVYDMYNHIYQTNKKPNGCGRCWTNTKKGVYQQYLKQTNIY